MKRILFLTGTRADFGKLKSLIKAVDNSSYFEAFLFVTGMHLLSKYGMTANEVEKSGFKNIYKFINQSDSDSMDIILAKTIQGFSDYVKEVKPDMIVIHGDRVEALAGSVVGSLNNILVSHIEGGEVSGTIDELIRHSVSKMSHLHFVCNDKAMKRLQQLGERSDSIFVIGSPDLDIMASDSLPTLHQAKGRYDIAFDSYAILLYHPVTTELNSLKQYTAQLVDAVLDSKENYIVIYPNNDHGTDTILNEFERFHKSNNIKLFPSIRFEYFLTLLKNAKFMIGNSSAGVREMPFYGLPSINIGTRQKGRAKASSIINCTNDYKSILSAIESIDIFNGKAELEFGIGNSDKLFFEAISRQSTWEVPKQKEFIDQEINHG
ncbi:UDP-N-acetylglucosamine 2-epimerase [Pseudoalteromonas phenolica]|uniref:UDP-N-acetylglucosamine 2-epimerase n=1 Tax=Pseudoalteromonas phenolica TaxID=161398 RepID=UPI00110BCB9C|nr:UDP-N-acetylglucosamine 2-epimerase [Pseudoalteromonas phenolica]TMO54074.1 UDP-N-acetylglucosamine 2-epimerase (hydrolyzing) [Pseudoalteromonas phenolica]